MEREPMNRKLIAGIVLMAAVAFAGVAWAHEGHAHKVMGTVTARHDNRVELKTQDGKTVTVMLNEKTTFARGKQKVSGDVVKMGERVVVEVVGEKDMTAKAVTLAAATPVAARK
jgi:urease accessory protein UreE